MAGGVAPLSAPAGGERLRVAAVGEIAEDVYLDRQEPHAGGISANFARWAQRAGAEATLFGPLGDDEAGRRVATALAASGIALRVRLLSGATARQRIRIEAGERVFCGFDPGVLGRYRLDEAELAAVGGHDVAAVPCSPESRAVFEQLSLLVAAGARCRLVADFSQETLSDAALAAALAEALPRLALAFVGGRATHLDALRALARASSAPIVLTVGAAGAYALVGERIFHQPSLVEAAVDTTGCGDAFQAAFTVAHFAGAPLSDALRAGALRAAEAAARRGAGP